MNLINWLTNLKLSVTQWLGITASAVIGALVIALKLQGGRLHRTQVDLLRSNMKATQKENDDAVEVARKKFAEALGEYNRHSK